MQFFKRTPNVVAYEQAFLYSNPPLVPGSLVWELEMQQRATDRARYPDYGSLYGDSTNNTGYTPGVAREAQAVWSPFTVPYSGPKSTVAFPYQPPSRVGYDSAAVDVSTNGIFTPGTTIQRHKLKH